MRIFAVAICFLIGVGAAKAEYLTGNELAVQCKLQYGVAMYVAGVIDKAESDEQAIISYKFDTNNHMKGLSAEQTGKVIADAATELRAIKLYCIPKGVTAGQVADVFCKYLKDNPADRHKNAADLVTTALNDAWACKPSDIK